MESIGIENNLFASIQSGDLTQVKKLIDSHTEQETFNDRYESAICFALRLQQLQIYELLVVNGFTLGQHENFEAIIEFYSMDSKRKLREIHKKCAKESDDKHLVVICSKCKLSHSTPDEMKNVYAELISKAFDDLNRISWIKPILALVSNAEDLKMIFDFDTKSVELMDPTSHSDTKGRCYYKLGDIYIGARGLLNEDDMKVRQEVLGVLAHELTHYAMDLLYSNSCKPYYPHENDEKEKFDEIIELCESSNEAYICSVYDYPEEHQVAELIVRVPHLLALYMTDTQKVDELKSSFGELFKFFEQKTLTDVKRSLPLVKAKNKIRELNRECMVLSGIKNSRIYFSTESLDALKLNLNSEKSILRIFSNFPQLTLKLIHQQIIANADYCIYMKLSMISDKKILKLIEEACELYSNTLLIIDCSGYNEIAETFESLEATTRIVLVTEEQTSFRLFRNATNVSRQHEWAQLTMESREKLMDMEIHFQGLRMKLNELFPDDSKAIESISLKALISGDLRIAERNPMSIIEYFVERKLLPASVKPVTEVREVYEVEYSMDEVINFAEAQNLILISDEPGMGKTVELQVMAERLKSKFPSRWLIFLNLKEHVHAFERDGAVTRSFDNTDDLATYFCDNILKISGFEKKLFIEIFLTDRALLVFDGVDEISPSYKQFVIRLIGETYRKTKNLLLVSSRPHLATELKANLNQVAYQLKPFTKSNRLEFFKKFLNVTLGNVELAVLQKIYDFSYNLKRSDQDVSFRNPLLMRLIAENLKDIELTESNCFLIYNSFVQCLVDRFMSKGCEAREFLKSLATSSDNIFEIHQKHAIEVIIQCDDDFKKTIRTLFTQDCSISNEQIVRIGFMYDDGSGNLHFVHRTFGEFFVADYLCKQIVNQKTRSKNEIKAVIKLFFKVFDDLDDNYKVIKIFLDKAFQAMNIKNLNKKDNKVCAELGKRLVKNNHHESFNQLAELGLLNVIKILTICMKKSKSNALSLWRGEKSISRDSILTVAASFQNVSFINGLWSIALDHLEGKLNLLLTAKTDVGQNVFQFALENSDSDVFDFILKTASYHLTDGELQAALSDNNILMSKALTNLNKTKLENFFSSLDRHLNHRVLKSLLLSTRKDDSNLMRAVDSSNENVVEVFWTFLTQILDFEDQKIILLFENADKRTALHHALIDGIESNQIFIINVYENFFGVERMRSIFLQNENIPKNVLYNAMKLQQTNRWKLMQSLFSGEVLKALLLRRNDEVKNVFEVWKGQKFLEESLKLFLPTIMSSFNVDEKREIGLFSAFHFAAANYPSICLNTFEAIGNHQFYKAFLGELLKEKNENGESMFCSALKRKDSQAFEKFCDEVGKTLGNEFFEEQ